jgi:hypothetical protein
MGSAGLKPLDAVGRTRETGSRLDEPRGKGTINKPVGGNAFGGSRHRDMEKQT